MNNKVKFNHFFNLLLIKIRHVKSKLIIEFAIPLLVVGVGVLISLETKNLRFNHIYKKQIIISLIVSVKVDGVTKGKWIPSLFKNKLQGIVPIPRKRSTEVLFKQKICGDILKIYLVHSNLLLVCRDIL